jgi:N-acyl-L-homoserine lactone synthetase
MVIAVVSSYNFGSQIQTRKIFCFTKMLSTQKNSLLSDVYGKTFSEQAARPEKRGW